MNDWQALKDGSPNWTQGTSLNPIPIPGEIGSMCPGSRLHLRNVDPIDSLDMLALQVAALTLDMAEIISRLDTLEQDISRHGRNYHRRKWLSFRDAVRVR
jgi:hypothetical protein